MKTLDEVIEAFEKADVRWSNDPHNPLEYPDFCDALHYLKEYRNCGACAYADSYLRCTKENQNDPLTWDELKQMDMQPVWYESLYWGIKTWAMVFVQKEGIYIDWYHRCQDGQIIRGNRCEIYKDQQGERWQAYRKERE